MRLAFGELVTDEVERAEARGQVLAVIERVAPEVLRALRDEVLPSYAARAHLSLPSTPIVLLPAGLRAALEAWANRLGFKAQDWLLEQALQTLEVWHRCPFLLEEPLEWAVYPGASYWAPVSPQERRLVFQDPGWNPAEETWAAAEKRIRQAFEQHLKAYRERIERRARERGFKRPAEKRARSGPEDLHFEWLVRHQVQGWTCERIAEEYGGADQAVSPVAIDRAIRETARLIGLRITPHRKGRKRKR